MGIRGERVKIFAGPRFRFLIWPDAIRKFRYFAAVVRLIDKLPRYLLNGQPGRVLAEQISNPFDFFLAHHGITS